MRILLADDHALFRDGLASLVAAWGHEMIAMVGTGPETVALAEAAEPDLVLRDVRMPGGGIAATSAIKTLRPDVAIVMLTVSEDEEDLSAAVKAGASGYLLKNLRGEEFQAMLEAVGRGEAALSPLSAKRILEEFGRPPGATASAAGPEQLTLRERDVLRAAPRWPSGRPASTSCRVRERPAALPERAGGRPTRPVSPRRARSRKRPAACVVTRSTPASVSRSSRHL